MMLDWNQYREQLLKAIGDLGRLSPQGARRLCDRRITEDLGIHHRRQAVFTRL